VRYEKRGSTLPAKTKEYVGVKFPPNVIKAAHQAFLEHLPEDDKRRAQSASRRSIQTGREHWSFDNDEEFFSEYRNDISHASIGYHPFDSDGDLDISFGGYSSSINVRLPEKYQVESVFEVFEDAAEASRLPEPTHEAPEPPNRRVFIGHGHSPLWRELADHLEYLQGFDVNAYETGPRAGLSVKETLQRLLSEASFAILIHTAEDEQKDGELRARENVIHETGLFQGRLGFERVIVLREEGCESFSNQGGINEIRFGTGNIKETYGEVVATLYREFPPNP
jgi:predicted nucleotide-binding protein